MNTCNEDETEVAGIHSKRNFIDASVAATENEAHQKEEDVEEEERKEQYPNEQQDWATVEIDLPNNTMKKTKGRRDQPEEEQVKEKCFSKRRNRFIAALGAIILLMVVFILAFTIPLTSSSAQSGPSWQPLGQEVGGKAPTDHFGTSVSLSRNAKVMAVGAQWGRPGYVSVFETDDSTGSWIPMGQELVGEVGAGGDDSFGVSVALNGIGTILSVSGAGHVLVFQHDTSKNRWVQLGSNVDREEETDEWFGWSVAMSKDGDIVAAGSPDSDGFRGSFRTHQYNRDTDTWEPLGQKVVGQAPLDWFGYAVSLSSSGTIAAVGVPEENDAGRDNAGQVMVYRYNAASSLWQPLGSPINGRIDFGRLGSSVSLDGSGLVVAIGAPGFILDREFTEARVYVFAYDLSTLTWTQRGQTLTSHEPGGLFGWSVSLSENGDMLAVGSQFHDANGLTDSGQVTIYQYNTQTMKWDMLGGTLNGKEARDEFGDSVSLSGDGTIVAVGADERSFNGIGNAGTASVYALN